MHGLGTIINVFAIIVGGLYGDHTVLVTKAIPDFIIIMVMAASLGKGTVFSAIPVALLQGGVTALSVLIKPIMTDKALRRQIFCLQSSLP